MKTKLTTILCALCVLCGGLSLMSCKTTGDIGADVQSYWNSPAAQALLQKIQGEAFAWITNQLNFAGASKSGASLRDRAIALEAQRHPNVPAGKIAEAVDAALAQAR